MRQSDIEKIVSAYKEGDLVKVSHLGKAFFVDLPKKIRKIVEVANFLTGSIMCSNLEEEIDYSSNLDIILSKVFFLEGDFDRYREIVFKTIENSKDPLTIFCALKEIKMFDEKAFVDYYVRFSGVNVESKRVSYLKKFIEKDYKGAIDEVSEFISVKYHPEILLDLADMWYYTAQYRELGDLCISMHRNSRINDYFWYLYAFSFFSSGKTFDAIVILEKLFRKYPKNLNILYNLAVSYYREGNFEKSLDYINLCQKIRDLPEISFVRGIVLYKLGNFEESKREFMKCSSYPVFQFSARYNMGMCDFKLGNYDSSISNLIKLRNESFVDKKNFEAIDKTISFIKAKSKRVPSYLVFLLVLVSSFVVSGFIYFALNYFGILR
ncbi:MAG: tetratricopeptide repeat protein [Brevinematia bacterium]